SVSVMVLSRSSLMSSGRHGTPKASYRFADPAMGPVRNGASPYVVTPFAILTRARNALAGPRARSCEPAPVPNSGAPGIRVPSGNGRTWQLLQFENDSATPPFSGTHRIDGTVPFANGSAFLKVSGLLAAAISFGSNVRRCR